MKIAKVLSAQNDCLEGQIIQVEVDISRGLHAFSIVGMADKAVAEARDRIASAIKHSGYKSPKSRNEKVVISLAPAQLPKEGTGFDLAMAIGYLIATKDVIPSKTISANAERILFIGELALDGNIRGIPGILPIIKSAREQGIREVFVANENIEEASIISDVSICGAKTLQHVIQHIEGKVPIAPARHSTLKRQVFDVSSIVDWRKYIGKSSTERALHIALAGRHTIAFIGPPGTGKTMIANSARTIAPDLTEEEILEVLPIYSSGRIPLEKTLLRPPFRAPHHSASYSSVIGGGSKQPIGEITLAHKGILFLDELPEFDRRVIEALRQPMEEKVVRISRAEHHSEFPADCHMIFAMNPCPCGYRGSRTHTCRCSQTMLRKYAHKISGPIVDRIDMWVPVEPPKHTFQYSLVIPSEKSGQWNVDNATEAIKAIISTVRDLQKNRTKRSSNEEVQHNITSQAMKLLIEQANSRGISNRGFQSVLRVARTIADLEKSVLIEEKHAQEALQYRVSPF